MSMAVERVMETFMEDLRQYKCPVPHKSSVVIHLTRVGQRGYYLGTLTAYDKDGRKSDRAIPFSQYIKMVNEIEEVLKSYKTTVFTGLLVGWDPTVNVKSFLYRKKVHRLFFLDDAKVLEFINEYTNPVRTRKREVEVSVTFG